METFYITKVIFSKTKIIVLPGAKTMHSAIVAAQPVADMYKGQATVLIEPAGV